MTTPKLWRHQRRALEHLQRAPRTALVVPMGGGKSRSVCEHLNRTRPARVLVLCPAAVISTWQREIRRWSPRLDCLPLIGPVTERATDLLACATAENVAVVTNYDVMHRKEMVSAVQAFAPDVLVLDEQHRVKAPNGRISRALRKLSSTIPSVIGLTGTPMPHSPLDLWAQALLTKPEVFGTSYPAFRDRYAVTGGPHGTWVLATRIQRTLKGKPNPHYDPALASEFAAKLRALCCIVTPDEVAAALMEAGLSYPPALPPTFRTHDLPPAARRVYDQLRDDFVAWLASSWWQEQDDPSRPGSQTGNGSVVTAANVLVKLLRLAQLASGKLEADDGTLLRHSERCLLLQDLLQDIPGGEPVVVFCRFRHELEDVENAAALLGLLGAHAELSGTRRDALDDQGRLREGVQLAGVQWQAGGVGVDLSRAAHVVVYGHQFSLGIYDQGIARLVRPGQTRAVSVTHLLAAGTVDEAVYTALTERRDVVEHVTGLALART